MTARNYAIILIVAFIGGALWLQKRYTNLEVSIEPSSIATAAPQATSSPARATTAAPTLSKQEEIRQLVLQSQSLQSDLSLEQQNLQNLSDQMQALQVQQQESQIQPPAGAMTSLQVQQNDLLIQNLADSLTFFPEAERRIHQQAIQDINLASSEAQMMRDQLDQNIQIQESLIRQTQEDITFWQFGGSNDLTEREARIVELQGLILQQQDQLAAMREQRSGIMGISIDARRSIQAQSQQALNALASERAEVQQQIGELRQQSWQGQVRTQQARTTQMSLRSQIQQLERAQQNQEQRIRTVQEAILQKEEQIRALH